MQPIFKIRNRRKSGKPSRRRLGAATVELAVCLPVITILALGAMEGSSMIFLRQALVQSAYETVKTSVRTNSNQAEGLIRGNQVLDFRNIKETSITFSPGSVDNLEPGTPVTVTVSAPGNSNTVFPFGPFKDQTITVQATMIKE